jgi:hypothetical protein
MWKQTSWLQSASEPYRSSDRLLSPKLMPSFAHEGVSCGPYDRNLVFVDRSRYFFFQAAPQLCSRGWVDPVPDPLLLRKSGSTGNRTWTSICSQELWPQDHRGVKKMAELLGTVHTRERAMVVSRPNVSYWPHGKTSPVYYGRLFVMSSAKANFEFSRSTCVDGTRWPRRGGGGEGRVYLVSWTPR